MRRIQRKENAGLEITDEFIASDEGKALNESILAEADESIKSLYAVFALAKEYGIDIENEAIIESANAAVESQEASYESKRAYKKALEDEHMTKTVAHTVAVFDTVYSEIYEAMLNSGEIVTDREKLREIYFSDEFIRIKELNLTNRFVRYFDGENDGLVGADSFEWGSKFEMLVPSGKRGISHSDMIDLNRENIKGFDVREFYVQLVSDLREAGC